MHKRRTEMIETGTRVEMTKGYRGVKGIILEKTDSKYEIYVLELDNGIHLVAGPNAFIPVEDEN